MGGGGAGGAHVSLELCNLGFALSCHLLVLKMSKRAAEVQLTSDNVEQQDASHEEVRIAETSSKRRIFLRVGRSI